MNPISHSLYWSANKLGLWIPTETPKWLVKAVEPSRAAISRKIYGKRKKVIQYYRGKTFIYKVTHYFRMGTEQGDTTVEYSCEKRLLNK